MIPLHGHDAAVAAFRAAVGAGRLHHAWLVAGPEGVGKGSFARAAALWALAVAAGPDPSTDRFEVEEHHPTAKLFESGSHPDLRIVKREVWKGKAPQDTIVPETERGADDALARSIRIRQIRGSRPGEGHVAHPLAPFLMTRPTFSDRRVVIIDAAEDLEPASANALLKMLEEPPAGTLFLLVSHAPDKLLPTIRSRCRLLRLAPLGSDAMASALRSALPDADEDEIAQLVAVGEGAPGRAIAFRGLDIAALDQEMERLVREGDPTNARRSALAQSLGLKSAQPRYEAFLARAPALIARTARERRGAALAGALALWERATALAASARRLSLDPQSTVFELAGMLAALAQAEGKAAA